MGAGSAPLSPVMTFRYIFAMTENDSLAHIEGLIAKFSEERDWDQFHTPKNLIMAATSEMY